MQPRISTLALFTSLAFVLVAGPTVASTVIPAGTISLDTTWDLAGSPYLVGGIVIVAGTDGADGVTTLTIEPGVEARFANGAQLQIGTTSTPPGRLVADGNASGGPATIVFTSDSATPTAGSWRGIEFRGGADAGTIVANVEILYAGLTSSAALRANHAAGVTIAVDDVTILDSGNYGIEIYSGTLAVTNSTIQGSPAGDVRLTNTANVAGSFDGCTLESVIYNGNLAQPIDWGTNTVVNYGAVTSVFDPDDLGAFLAGATVTAVPDATTEILGGSAQRTGVWSLAASPYVFRGMVTIQGESGALATITVEPGVELRFNGYAGLTVGGNAATAPGALIADGDAGGSPATILFTANTVSPAPGFWRGLRTWPGMDDSTVLRNVEIRYAGQINSPAVEANQAEGSVLTIERATITDSAAEGVELARGDTVVTDSTIRDCASGDVYIANAASLTGSFSGNTLESVVYVGIAAPPITWTNNTFVDYGAVTSRIDPDDLGDFLATSTFTKVPGAVTEVLAGIAGRSGTWTLDGSPYIVLGAVEIKGEASVLSEIVIEPGVELRFSSSFGLTVGGTNATLPGALIADGNASGGPATIVFTADGSSPTPGSWRGIYTLAGMHPSTVLRNVEIAYAGASGYAGVYAKHAAGTTLTIDQATIRDSSTEGIRVYAGDVQVTDSTIVGNPDGDVNLNGSSSVSGSFTANTLGSVVYIGVQPQPINWSGNTFVDYGAVTSRVDPDDLGEFLATSSFTKVTGAVTEVLAGTVTRSGTWTLVGAPYIVLGLVPVQGSTGLPAELTIEPGVVLRMGAGAGFNIGGGTAATPAALIADGDGPGGPATIVLTSDSSTPAPGAWRGIQFRVGTEPTSVLRNVEIAYPGAYSLAGVYAAQGAGVTVAVDRVSIHDSATQAIRITSGDLAVTDSVLRDSGLFDVSLNTNVAVTASFTGNTIESVRYEGGAMGPIVWSGNTFDNWGQETSKVRVPDLDPFTRDNTFNPVPGAVLDVLNANVVVDSTWGPAAGPLLVDNSFYIRGTDGPDGITTLTLEPGVTVRVPGARTIYVGGGGDPGELIADGAPGGVYQDTINFSVDNDVPNAGDWNGIRVEPLGRAMLRHAQVRYATSGVRVTGTLAASSNNVTVNRSNIGLELSTAAVEGVLRGWSLRNCDIGVRATATDVTFREANLFGATYGVQNLSPDTHCVDAELNFWGTDDGPSGAAPVVGCETSTPAGTGAAITEGVVFASFLDLTPDDGDTIVCDDGDGFRDPCTGGVTVGCDDNCCEVANDSQSDLDGDGVGDACDSNPVLRVSSDPADLADFAIVQDAVDVSVQSGTRVEILPGLGPYHESVRLDRSQVYAFVGVTNESLDPIVVDGGTGPAFRVINKVGTTPMTFRDLLLRGGQGIRATVDTASTDLVFDQITGEALQLDGGAHALERAAFGPVVGVAARIEAGAALDARRVEVHGANDAGFDTDGALVLENALVAGGVDGVRVRANGSLDARYVTIADNTGVGIDATAGGTVVSVDRSIVHGNAIDDVLGAACAVMTWCDTGSPDCSSVNDNLSADPVLDVDYRLAVGSPCLDHGPDAATYTGDPATDLDGGVRIADYDADGFAVNDCGAFEMINTTVVPGEVAGLRWDFDFRLLWDAEPDAAEYHVYRDLLSNLGYTSFGACRDDLDTVRTDLQLDDLDEPDPGAGFIYLITAETVGGDEGTLGFATSAERSNFNACP